MPRLECGQIAWWHLTIELGPSSNHGVRLAFDLTGFLDHHLLRLPPRGHRMSARAPLMLVPIRRKGPDV